MTDPSPDSIQQMPPDAKLVFEGEIYKVFQWKQRQFDGSVALFEKVRRPDTVKIVPITSSGKVVVCYETQPSRGRYPNLIGGRVDDGETSLDAAMRELAEEAALSSTAWRRLGSHQPSAKIEWSVHYWIAGDCSESKIRQADASERIELCLLDPKAFCDFVCQPSFDDLWMKTRVLQLRLNNAGSFDWPSFICGQ